jgi:protein SCO1/2
MRTRTLLTASAAVLLLAAVAGVAVAELGGSSGGGRSPSGATQLPPGLAGTPAPRIRLRDGDGRLVDTAALRGRPYAVTFLYTRCPDVCPLIGDELHDALADLGSDARKVAAVGVSVDPPHDTPSAIRAWERKHRLAAPFTYVNGTEAQLRPVWKAYFAAPQVPGDPDSSHTAAIWFVDGAGRLRAMYSAGIALDPTALADEYRKLLGSA